ncbi:MAG: M28 family peptidase [Candidatus Geothermincolia bacterium]
MESQESGLSLDPVPEDKIEHPFAPDADPGEAGGTVDGGGEGEEPEEGGGSGRASGKATDAGHHERKRLPLLQSYARKLSAEIGSRPAGSRAEAAAAAFIEATMSARHADVVVEEFRAPRSPLLADAMTVLLPLFAVLAYVISPAAGFIVIVCGMIVYQLRDYGALPLDFLQLKCDSANVISRIQPASEDDRRTPTLVCFAHYDSPVADTQSRLASFFAGRSGHRLTFASILLIFMLYLVGVGALVLKAPDSFRNAIWWLSLAGAVPVAVAAALALDRLMRHEPSAGANDNASGVAVLLGLQRRFQRKPPAHIAIWFVATGAGAGGSAGIRDLLEEHSEELGRAYFVSLESVGRKRLRCIRREGALFSYRANRKLLAHGEAVAEKHAQFGVGSGTGGKASYEMLRLLARRRRAMTLRGEMNLAGGDEYDALDPDTLRDAYDFMVAFINSFDKSARS